jgi:hypothetical protein
MKYKTRNEYTISTVSGSKKREDHWLTDLENQLLKEAVQPRNVDQSMFDQINGIIGGSRSKYRSVTDAVEDMQRRSGYFDYINKKIAEESSNQEKKLGTDKKPRLFLEYPQIEITVNNYCSHTKGEQDIPAILNHVRGIHERDVLNKSLWDEVDLAQFVHSLNENLKQHQSDDSNHHLGKLDMHSSDTVDPANYDSWHGLMPVKR